MSDNEHTTVRIVDIARMAGVSVATVDRVIHNRGKVSKEIVLSDFSDGFSAQWDVFSRPFRSCPKPLSARLL